MAAAFLLISVAASVSAQNVVIDRERFFEFGDFAIGLSPHEQGVAFDFFTGPEPFSGVFIVDDFSIRFLNDYPGESGEIAFTFFESGDFLLRQHYEYLQEGFSFHLFRRGSDFVIDAEMQRSDGAQEIGAVFDTSTMTIQIEEGITELQKSDIPYYNRTDNEWNFRTQSYTMSSSPRILSSSYTSQHIERIEVLSDNMARVVFDNDAIYEALHAVDYITTNDDRYAVWTLTFPRGETIPVYVNLSYSQSRFNPRGEETQYARISYTIDGTYFVGSMTYRGINERD